MTKVLLFDFDGTIADSFENFIEIVNHLSLKYHLPTLSREELEKLRSEDARTLIKKLKIPFYKIPFIGRDMKKMQHQHIAQIKIFNGLPETLKKLKNQGYKLGILTSNGKENVNLFIKNNNIDLFNFLYNDSSLFGKDKVIRNFLKENALTKEQVIYIGDEIRDIQACQKVGIKIIAVTWGFNSKEGLLNNNPDYLVNSPAELWQLLEQEIIT